MRRRDLLKAALAAPFLPFALSPLASAMTGSRHGAIRHPVRPGQSGWPSAAQWDALKRRVGGRLIQPESPFAPAAPAAARAKALEQLQNPFFLGDQPALTQTSGWAGAWQSQPSAYAVVAESAADVAAAVDFAREHHLRLVVKGGGHSYQGTSSAPDSILVWTRQMNHTELHDAFVPHGCVDSAEPAVSLGAGCMWIDAYDAVTTRGGRYVQGGGCTTVGVAGLVQSGGFGSFSKRWGTAASHLLEAEVVTADGQIRLVNACTDPDLFWAIKGGGGGSFGVLTRITLRTHDLPETFGAVTARIAAADGAAFRALIAEAMRFYRRALFNPHWGEQMSLRSGHILGVSMVFQGLTQAQAEAVWAPFVDWIKTRPEYTLVEPLQVTAMPARHFWDADFFRAHAPGVMAEDNRPNAPRHHMVWAGDRGQVGWFLHAYQSAWLPADLLEDAALARLTEALYQAAQAWDLELHFNKGLAGAPGEAIDRAADTATHPDVLGAFALALVGAFGAPAFSGMPADASNDQARIRRGVDGVARCMAALRMVAPRAGSYLSESDYFLDGWKSGFWGVHYPRLAAAKRRYDPKGLFTVHHGVGSES
ncbi:MAG: FAD-linked oxidase [Rhodanobacter sp. SCN 65-17]|nr:MAG: FAD-linked oxidase [Rhodanobacter sp. SCN 65-17]